jgi:hypothetical protein
LREQQPQTLGNIGKRLRHAGINAAPGPAQPQATTASTANTTASVIATRGWFATVASTPGWRKLRTSARRGARVTGPLYCALDRSVNDRRSDVSDFGVGPQVLRMQDDAERLPGAFLYDAGSGVLPWPVWAGSTR